MEAKFSDNCDEDTLFAQPGIKIAKHDFDLEYCDCSWLTSNPPYVLCWRASFAVQRRVRIRAATRQWSESMMKPRMALKLPSTIS